MKRLLVIALSLSATPCLHAQWEVDRAIRLEGVTPADRQVSGLPLTESPEALLSAGIEQAGAYRYDEPAAASVWAVTLPGLTNVQAGTHITVKVPANAQGTVQLAVNGGAAGNVLWRPGDPLDAASVPEGMILSLVFEGQDWQVMNGIEDRALVCPADMSAVGDQFCIERPQRAEADFAAAAVACASEGRRLCTWGEFIAACQRRTTLGLQNPVSDWEWTNDSANEVNSVRVVKLANCLTTGVRLMSTPPALYRCCLTR